MARVEIYKTPPGGLGHEKEMVSNYEVFPRCDRAEVEFELDCVDTSRVALTRRFMFLDDFDAKVILAPTDDRLDAPISTRLVGKCYFLTHVSCVREASRS